MRPLRIKVDAPARQVCRFRQTGVQSKLINPVFKHSVFDAGGSDGMKISLACRKNERFFAPDWKISLGDALEKLDDSRELLFVFVAQ
ncbi:hypothetical protein D3C80_1348570 [compost metagenome]